MLLTLRIYWVIHKVLYLEGDIFLKKRWGDNFIIQFGFYITGRNFSTFLLNDKKKGEVLRCIHLNILLHAYYFICINVFCHHKKGRDC